MSFESPWLFWRTNPAPADRNMACDEALLEAVGALHCPVLRVYGWDPPAASFGYSQRYDDICAMTRIRPLVRRPTGGGLVPHERDWTYSFSVPPDHWWYAFSAVDSYRTIHEWIASAFSRMGIETTLSASSRPAAPGQCFAGAERHDVVWQGRKVAGAAQRRNRLGLLIQGSVQPPPIGLSRTAWERELLLAGSDRWGVKWVDWDDPEGFSDRVGELAQCKYGSEAHLRRR